MELQRQEIILCGFVTVSDSFHIGTLISLIYCCYYNTLDLDSQDLDGALNM